MKIELKEFERLLNTTKSMSASDRLATIETLKSASVFERDAKGNETPVEVTLLDRDDGSVSMIGEAELGEVVKRMVGEMSPPINRNPLKFGGDPGAKSGHGARMGAFLAKALGRKNADGWMAQCGLKGHIEGDNSLGGYLVPTQVTTDLIRLVETYGVARREMFNLPMTSDTATRPRRAGGLTASFVGETQSGTQSTMSLDQIQLTAKKLMSLSIISSELSEDSFASIGEMLSMEMAHSFAQKEDQCAFIGDGTSTYGGIVGLTTKLTTINGTDDGGGIVLGTGNAWSELTLADFQNVIARTPSFAKANAKWFMSPTFIDQVPMKFALNAGGITASEILGGVKQRMFLGYPIVPVEVMPTAQANSQVCALFGNLKLSSTFGDRRSITVKLFDSGTADSIDLLTSDQIAVRATERFDVNNHDLGDSSNPGAIVGLITASS